eukprot:SAG11_NODE_8061_length_1064_cov_1.020725_1_plen_24_part_10
MEAEQAPAEKNDSEDLDLDDDESG